MQKPQKQIDRTHVESFRKKHLSSPQLLSRKGRPCKPRWRTRTQTSSSSWRPSSTTLTAEGDLLLEDQKFEPFKIRTWAVASPIEPFKIIRVLRLNVMFGNPRPKRRQHAKTGGRKVVRKASETHQKAPMTESSVATSTSIQDSPPSSYW